MRIAYHPSSATMSLYDLNLWIAASISAWPIVTGGTLITVRNPVYPFRMESDTQAEDRTTLGGLQYSKIAYTRENTVLSFENVSDADVVLWRALYSATKGFRYPFIVEHPVTLALKTMLGAQDFPFMLQRQDASAGTVKLMERP